MVQDGSSGRAFGIAAMVVVAVVMFAQCGRVSFLGENQTGDAGNIPPPDAGGAASSSSSSTSSGNGSSGCGGLGPEPTFAVTAADVTAQNFATNWTNTGGSNCSVCHPG